MTGIGKRAKLKTKRASGRERWRVVGGRSVEVIARIAVVPLREELNSHTS
jgi:hypothetical protein